MTILVLLVLLAGFVLLLTGSPVLALPAIVGAGIVANDLRKRRTS